jgi:YVTN family beta-propeller protein
VTNTIYVATPGDGTTSVINGATDTLAATIPKGSPSALAVNAGTNKLYVASNDGTVAIINGVTNGVLETVRVGSTPIAVAVNPVTNKVYVINQSSSNVTVIDGNGNTANVLVGTTPKALAVNPVTNKIYVTNLDPSSYGITVIDGVANTTTNVAAGSYPFAIAVNPITNKVYIACQGGSVTVVTEQPVEPGTLTTAITPLPNNQAFTATPNFTFTVQGTGTLAPDAVYFQLDTWQNEWTKASESEPLFSGDLAGVQPGFHILYAYATDGRESTPMQLGSPITGAIQAYGFLVAPPPPMAQTISFGFISSQTVGTSVKLTATASSGLPVFLTSTTSNVCAVKAATANLSNAGYCTITASQPGNGSYLPAPPVSQSFVVRTPVSQAQEGRGGEPFREAPKILWGRRRCGKLPLTGETRLEYEGHKWFTHGWWSSPCPG